MRRSVLTLLAAVILLPVGATGVSAAPPTNDDIADARVVSALPYTDDVDTTEATLSDADEGCFQANTVWYRFRPTANITARVEVDAEFDATVTVFRGSRDNLAFVGCADEAPSLTFDARSGTTYHIVVAAWDYDPGGLATLTVRAIQPPTLAVRLSSGAANTRTGDALVRTAISCDHATSASFQVQVRQRSRTGRIVTGWTYATVRCNGSSRRSRTLVLSDWSFKAGWARVRVTARVCSRGACVSRGVNRVILLGSYPAR